MYRSRLHSRLLTTAAAAFLVSFAPLARAEVPPLVQYQGILKDKVGAQVPDGSYGMTFRLYAAPTGSDPLWTEAHAGEQTVAVKGGGFSVQLGNFTLLTPALLEQPALYLGLTAGDDTEMALRGTPSD